MPLYDYKCPECGHEDDLYGKNERDLDGECDNCGKPVTATLDKNWNAQKAPNFRPFVAGYVPMLNKSFTSEREMHKYAQENGFEFAGDYKDPRDMPVSDPSKAFDTAVSEETFARAAYRIENGYDDWDKQ